MSIADIGRYDVSDRMQALKDQLAAKDTRCASLETQLMRQQTETEELRKMYDETLLKLQQETQQVLVLEGNLERCNKDLSKEKVNLQNVTITLATTEEKWKTEASTVRELQSSLEALASRSENISSNETNLIRIKSNLENRIRAMEAEIRDLNSSLSLNKSARPPPQRSSSPAPIPSEVDYLKKEAEEARLSMKKKDEELRSMSQKLSLLQTRLLQAENEMIACEKTSKEQIEELQQALEACQDELEFAKNDSAVEREEELLKRTEEDAAKIAALESLLKQSDNIQEIKHTLEQTRQRLETQRRRSDELESQNDELTTEKEEALRALDDVRRQLVTQSQESEARERLLTEKLIAAQSNSAPSDDQVSHVDRLLVAIDRLRGERNRLAQDLEFVTAESRFTISAMERQLAEAGAHDETPPLRARIKYLALASTATAVALSHLQSSNEALEVTLLERESELHDVRSKLDALNTAYIEKDSLLSSSHSAITSATQEREEMFGQLAQVINQQTETSEELRATRRDHELVLEELQHKVVELTRSLESVESQRDSLNLELLNLRKELATAQEDNKAAEARYSTLQQTKLASLSANDATRVLREQIEELEDRVLRRTEQVGIHQHDIRRLETNMRLNEERIEEMMAEIETLTAEKQAMVEDCADAREARDDAVKRREEAELELENLEARMAELKENTSREVETLQQQIHELERTTSDEIAALIAAAEESSAHQEAQSREIDEQKSSFLDQIAEMEQHIADVSTQLQATQQQIVERDLALEQQNSQYAALAQALSTSQHDLHHVTVALALSQQGSQAINQLLQVSKEEQELLTNQLAETRGLLDAKTEELQALKASSEEEIQCLQSKVEETVRDLNAARDTLANAEASDLRAREANSTRVKELEEQISASTTTISEIRDKCDELVASRERLEKEVEDIRGALDQARVKAEEAVRSLKKAEDRCSQLEEQAAKVQEDAEARLEDSSRKLLEVDRHHETELEELRSKHAKSLGELEAQIEFSTSEIERLNSEIHSVDKDGAEEITSLRSALDAQTERYRKAEVSEIALCKQLTDAREHNARIEHDLQALQAENDEIQKSMTSLTAENQKSLSTVRHLEKQAATYEETISTLKANLEEVNASLAETQKASQVTEVNFALQAQDLASVRRELVALREKPNLEEVVAELREKNQEMDELLRQKSTEIEENDDRFIELLKEKKKLLAKIDVLTRKVQNLQKKLQEQPSAPESSHASSSAPKSSSPNLASEPPVPLTLTSKAAVTTYKSATKAASSSSSTTHVPNAVVSEPVLSHVSPPQSLTSDKPVPSTSALRAKSPENPVEKPSFAEPITQLPEASPSTGKKRRLPDDFDQVVVPVQTFTADSLPTSGIENHAHRIRRNTHGPQSGFTPVRHTTSRSTTKPTSPVRRPLASAAPAPSHPNAAAQTSNTTEVGPKKRTWLGKIRGAAAPPTTNSKP